MAAQCKYCGVEIEQENKTACEFCNGLIQEANCHGVYLADAANAIAKRDDLSTPQDRRTALQEKYDLYVP